MTPLHWAAYRESVGMARVPTPLKFANGTAWGPGTWYLLITSILMVGQYFLEKRFARGFGSQEKAQMRVRGLAAEQGGGGAT